MKNIVEKKRPVNVIFTGRFNTSLVELAGFEPASKQVAKLLSTCLSVTWLSKTSRQSADLPVSYPLLFRPGCGEQTKLFRHLRCSESSRRRSRLPVEQVAI